MAPLLVLALPLLVQQERSQLEGSSSLSSFSTSQSSLEAGLQTVKHVWFVPKPTAS